MSIVLNVLVTPAVDKLAEALSVTGLETISQLAGPSIKRLERNQTQEVATYGLHVTLLGIWLKYHKKCKINTTHHTAMVIYPSSIQTYL